MSLFASFVFQIAPVTTSVVEPGTVVYAPVVASCV